MARAISFIKSVFGFKQNPFPASAIAQWGSSDERENGSLFNSDVCAPDYEEAVDKFIVSPVDSGSKFHFLWSLGEGEEARGFGKTALLRHLAAQINSDFGAKTLGESDFDEEEVRETPIMAAMGTFDRTKVTSLSAVSLEQVISLAQSHPLTGKSALMMLRERLVQQLRDNGELLDSDDGAEADLIRQRIAETDLSLGGKTLGSPDRRFITPFANADWSPLITFLRQADAKAGFELLSSYFIVARSAGVKRIFLFIDQMEDFASADIPKKRRSTEVERFRDLAIETQPFGEMASYVLTMHPGAARSIEQFWSLARLPRIDHLAKQSERITVVLKPVRRVEDAEVLILSYMDRFRNGPIAVGDLHPFDRASLNVLMEFSRGRPGSMLKLAHDVTEQGARQELHRIGETEARQIIEDVQLPEIQASERPRRRRIGALEG